MPSVPYWIHVDADVIDSALLGAVDSPAPGGLTFEELAALLRSLLEGPGGWGSRSRSSTRTSIPTAHRRRALTDCLVGAPG